MDGTTVTGKNVAIAGMIGPGYQGDADALWVINRAYQIHKDRKIDRVYFFDELDLFDPCFPDELNALPDTAVYTRRVFDQINGSRPYPIDLISARFGLEYFTCTAAYMIAHALYEGAASITLHGMYHPADSLEYMHHKPCVDFWLGVAVGLGVKVVRNSEMCLMEALPWQSNRYGYIRQINDLLPGQTLAAAYRACMNYPVCFREAETGGHVDNQTRRKFMNAMLNPI